MEFPFLIRALWTLCNSPDVLPWYFLSLWWIPCWSTWVIFICFSRSILAISLSMKFSLAPGGVKYGLSIVLNSIVKSTLFFNFLFYSSTQQQQRTGNWRPVVLSELPQCPTQCFQTCFLRTTASQLYLGVRIWKTLDHILHQTNKSIFWFCVWERLQLFWLIVVISVFPHMVHSAQMPIIGNMCCNIYYTLCIRREAWIYSKK